MFSSFLSSSSGSRSKGLNNTYVLLLLVYLLLLGLTLAQEAPPGEDGTTLPTTPAELEAKLAPYSKTIGGIICALGVILGT